MNLVNLVLIVYRDDFMTPTHVVSLFISVRPTIAGYHGDHHIRLSHHLYELPRRHVPRPVLLQAPTVEQDQYPYQPGVCVLHMYPGICDRD